MTQPRDDRGRFAPYGFTLGSLLAVGAISVGAATSVGASGAGGSAAASANAPTVSVQARTARGQQRAGRVQRALLSRGTRVALRGERDSESCAANARGQVREFLSTHSCEAVFRTLVEVRQGDVAALAAIAWIDMTELDDATELKALVDQPGTGNVNALPPPRGQRVVGVVEPAYASRRRGRLVVTVEVAPVAVTTGQRALEEVAEQVADGAGQP